MADTVYDTLPMTLESGSESDDGERDHSIAPPPSPIDMMNDDEKPTSPSFFDQKKSPPFPQPPPPNDVDNAASVREWREDQQYHCLLGFALGCATQLAMHNIFTACLLLA